MQESENNNNLPFDEVSLGDNTFLRTFYQSTDSGEMQWHRDREDRIIESVDETDWGFQLDNQLPKKIEYFYDQIHFSNAGARQVANILYPQLSQIIK